MKKKLFLIIMLVLELLVVGCDKPKEKSILKEVFNKIEKTNGYKIIGELEIFNNEDSYKYDVESFYQKENNYKIELKNKINNHEQIILKNNDGVYVITPSLNKSYKFDTDWPFNNSQIYLLQTLKKDLENKEERTFEIRDEKYIFTVKANYINNPSLSKQVIVINKKYDIEEIKVFNQNDQIQMKMVFNSIDYNSNFEENEFKLVNKFDIKETNKNLDAIVYPMYLPNNTQLTGQEKISLENGERFILTFGGESPFTIIQETVKTNKDLITIPTFGEPAIITDTVGVIDDNSLSWVSNGVEFYIMSEKLDKQQMIEVANSINTKTVGK